MSRSAEKFIRDSAVQERLNSQGYAVVNLLDTTAVVTLKNHYENDRPLVNSHGFHSTMFVDDENYRLRTDEYLKTQLSDPLSVHFSEFNILFANYIMKEADSESAVGIHQDWAFVDETNEQSFNVWFPLVDTNSNNGALWVLPGSHKLGRFPRYSPSDLKVDEEAVLDFAKPVYLNAGQAVIYHSSLLHFSSRNTSSESRLAIGLVCIPQESQPVHYFKNGNEIEKFNVDSEFFRTHVVDARPIGYEVVSTSDVETEKNAEIDRAQIENAVAESMNEVGKYYDDWHERYEDVYGSVIQAVRPTSDKALLDYLIESIGLRAGMRIVDAGAGVCGPAVHFAKHAGVHVDALTVSSKQAKAANDRIEEEGVCDKVNCRLGDYHDLSSLYEVGSYDAVVFLESLGHAQNPDKVIKEAVKLLKPGGFIYIKDFYPRETDDTALAERIRKTIENINRHYVYNVLDLHDTLTSLRKSGMAIQHIAPVRFEDDISVRSEFESRFDIEIFEGGEFAPAEWLEIKCVKAF